MNTQKLCISLAMTISLLAVAGMLTLLGVASGGPSVIEAKGSAPYVAPGGDCGGASPCYGSVQEAVNAANDGDVIKVAAGTYTDIHMRDGITQVVYITKSVTVRGGYTTTDWTTSDPGANHTTLDAQRQGRVVYITGEISPTVESLRLTGGDADIGGGIYIQQATATISNNMVFSNTATNRGGGLYLENSPVTVTGNAISSNTAHHGGGLSLDNSPSTFNGNTITANTADWGGGLSLANSAAILHDNVISGNTSVEAGGGLYLNHSAATLNSNTVSYNTATPSGGAVYLNYSDATIDGNMFISNGAHNALFFWHSDATLDANIIANSQSGVFLHASDVLLTNNVIADNQYTGVDIEGASADLTHNTIARNNVGISITDRWQDGSYYSSTVVLTNTILTSHNLGIYIGGDNSVIANGVLWYDTSITVSHSITATVAVLNEHTGDPAFADDGYHITPTSAAMDIGLDTDVSHDIDRHYRPYRFAPDVGADEIIATVVSTDTEATLVYTSTQGLTTAVQIPSSAVTDTTMLVYAPVEIPTGSAGSSFVGYAFDLDAYRSGTLLTSFVFSQPVTITMYYDEAALGDIDEDALVLEYWNEDASEWQDVVSTCTPMSTYERHPSEDWLAVPICHLSRFALFGGYKVFLPLVLRNY